MLRSSSFTAAVSWKTSAPSRQDRVRPSASGSSLLHGCSCNQKLLSEGQLMAEYFGYIFWSCSPQKKSERWFYVFGKKPLNRWKSAPSTKAGEMVKRNPWSALCKETPDPARHSVNYSRMICACFIMLLSCDNEEILCLSRWGPVSCIAKVLAASLPHHHWCGRQAWSLWIKKETPCQT